MPSMQGKVPTLFIENGLGARDVSTCQCFARQQYPGRRVDEIRSQGCCSYTLLVQPATKVREDEPCTSPNETLVLQFRLRKHAIEIDVASEATKWYGSLAPFITDVGRIKARRALEFHVYQMSYLHGTRLSDLQPLVKTLNDNYVSKYRSLIECLIDAFATAWKIGIDQQERSLSPRCNGKVGSTILRRLKMLEGGLPTDELRYLASGIGMKVQAGLLDRLPLVLTHGDLIPSNIMVDIESWQVTGFVDWAEAEYLPFGMCFYVLDHLFGYLDVHRDRPVFVYYAQAHQLRRHFWGLLVKRIPILDNEGMSTATALARDVGVLLWHGLAWNDGRIDRVVEPDKDAKELAYLNAFLSTERHHLVSKL